MRFFDRRRGLHARPGGTRRRWKMGLTAVAAVAITGLFVASALGVLTGSPSGFESGDGDMTVAATASGNSDWNCVADSGTTANCGAGAGQTLTSGVLSGPSPSYVASTDLFNTTGDDSWNNGAKMDKAACPSVTKNKNPAKDDFTNVASYNDTNADTLDTYLYGATIRYAANGNASENVELQQGTAGSCGTDPVTGNKLYNRVDGDQLLLIDYLNGGANVQVHKTSWITNNATEGTCLVGSDSAPCWSSKVASLSGTAFEGKANQAAIQAADDGISPGTALTAGQFAEFGVDLTAAGILPSASSGTCESFANAIWESRSSGSSFSSNPEDISVEPHSISNCGSLSVTKYIDANENGSFDQGSDNPSSASTLSADLAGWSFTVSGPSGTCSGTTGTTGALGACTTTGGATLDLSKLSPGTYTVTENANAGKTIGTSGAPFFNTDPGNGSGGIADPATATVSKAVKVNLAGGTVAFGNSCYATAGFEVDGVPSNASGVFVTYRVSSDGGTTFTPATYGSADDLDLVKQSDGTSWKASSPANLRAGQVVDWSWGVSDGSGEQSLHVGRFTVSGYPTCGGSGQTAFAGSRVSGVKYKDVNADGTRNVDATGAPTEPGLQGFAFQLLDASNAQIGAVQLSGASGAFSFANLAPGAYTIREVHCPAGTTCSAATGSGFAAGPPSGWTETQPAANSVPVNVSLGDTTDSTDTSGNPIAFGNSPLSKVSITFLPQAKLLDASGNPTTTDATKATVMQCTSPQGIAANPQNLGDAGSSTGSNSLTSSNLRLDQSQVTCTVTFTDP